MSNTHTIRIFVESVMEKDIPVILPEACLHHLLHVMRKKAGDTIHIFNATCGEWQATILSLSKKKASVIPQKKIPKQENLPDITLCFSIIKNTSLHFMVQKATELGVSNLQPIITDHTSIRNTNIDKLYTYAIEAAQQCERLSIPNITKPISLDNYLNKLPTNFTIIFCDESGNGVPLNQQLFSSQPQLPISILIGPEGGFSKREQTILQKHNQTLPVTLGPRILKADTAALCTLTCLQCFMGDWNSKPTFKSII